ncbi:MAG: NAD-dependent epimerase/dehydratase family protein [Terriglobales bacterium]
MKVLVAGGAGYIGSALIPHLLERGYKVDVVDLFWFGNHLPAAAGVVPNDIFHLTKRDLEGYDQVVFLAGLSNDPMAEYSPGKNFVYNAAAPAYLAYMAKQAKVRRYVYASSCSVYGYTENELYNEDRPLTSSYPYGISKLQGERAVMQMVDENFSVISLRKGTVSGYSPRMRYDLIINTMFKCAMRDGVINVNNPAIWRPFLSIDDAVMAYTRAIEAHENISGIFNVASGNHTVGEIADLVKLAVEQEMGKKVILNIHHLPDVRNYKVSIERAENTLSFHPHQTVRSIVRNLIENMAKCSDWDNPMYYNIDVFKALEARVHHGFTDHGAASAAAATTGAGQ